MHATSSWLLDCSRREFGVRKQRKGVPQIWPGYLGTPILGEILSMYEPFFIWLDANSPKL